MNLNSTHNFELVGVEEKRCRILCKFESVKKTSPTPHLTKANIWNHQIWFQMNMKTDFQEVIFTDIFWVPFDESDRYIEEWISSNSDMSVPKKKK